MYEYIVYTNKGSTHMCYTYQEAVNIMKNFNRLGIESNVFKRLKDM